MIDIQSATAENRREKRKKKKKEEPTAAKYNGLPYWAAIINLTAYAGYIEASVADVSNRRTKMETFRTGH